MGQESFLEMINSLNPHAETVSESTVKRDLMAEHKKRVQLLKDYLKNVPGKISFTIDGWTSKNVISFTAIRAHWINSEWTYETVLLDFMFVEGSHSGQSVCDQFVKCLEFFAIPLSKVLAVTADNVSSNDTLMTALEVYGIASGTSFTPDEHRVRCMAHILNLSVQDIIATMKIAPNCDTDESDCIDIIDDEDLFSFASENAYEATGADDGLISDDSMIEKLRKLVRKIRKSPQKRQELKKCCDVICTKLNIFLPFRTSRPGGIQPLQ